MSFEERHQWLGLWLTLGGGFAYVVALLVMVQTQPLTEVAWGPALLVIILGCGGVYGVVYAIGRRRAGPADERERAIERFGEFSGRGMVDISVLAAITMLALGVEGFWVAQVLFFGSWLGAVIGVSAKLAAYREGLPE
jgi:hypothetical protein